VLGQVCARGHARKAQGEDSWWKDEETVLACLGSVAELVEESLEEVGGKSLNLERIFQQVFMPNIGSLGKCRGSFHRHLDSEVVRSFARRIISCLVPLVSAAQEDVLVLLLDTVQAVVGGFWGACGAGTGEVMLNWVLHELRRVYADVEIKASDLVMRVRETVV